MKGKLYAEFMEHRGRNVFYGAGSHWYEVERGMIMALPYHEVIDPSDEPLLELLARTRSVGARYLTTAGNGLNGGLYVRRKSAYDEMSLHKKSRNRLRRALEKCAVREVEEDELRSQGLDINRQGRSDPEFGEQRRWNRLVDACYARSGIKVMGAFADGRLAAYAVNLTEDGWLHILHMFSGTSWLAEHFPNDALAFHITKAGMEAAEVDQISYGVAGLSQSAGLHQFKERYGYEFVPRGYAFVLRPWVRSVLVNPASAWAIRRARALFPNRNALERIGSVALGASLTGSQRAPASTPLAAPLTAISEEARHG
jgi:hypothetical protein